MVTKAHLIEFKFLNTVQYINASLDDDLCKLISESYLTFTNPVTKSNRLC